ncbi:hypothetical protein SeMB42_g06644 [Synchytrium endobioticum]|uniref:CRESS-DNA virus Rep endonuclease domain-containing protein n=1 Tax=Synchytrium endobioticum TaxID=286115 RepID=A0A507CK11_9FUNG|nr:hypothetical protein SeMB42_g06644 [Synchytrium endobioticum]
MATKFDKQGAHWFLTYSCPQDVDINPLSEEMIVTYITNQQDIAGYIVATEEHQNAKIHYHAIISYKSKLRVRNARHFDINNIHHQHKHMYYNNMFNMDDWDDGTEYIIFDDFEWQFTSNKKPFIFGQQEFTITDKYKKKKTVRWGKPCIYINNHKPDWNAEKDPYLDNIVIEHVEKSSERERLTILYFITEYVLEPIFQVVDVERTESPATIVGDVRSDDERVASSPDPVPIREPTIPSTPSYSKTPLKPFNQSVILSPPKVRKRTRRMLFPANADPIIEVNEDEPSSITVRHRHARKAFVTNSH